MGTDGPPGAPACGTTTTGPMKPNFALTLSFETIALLRRTSRGWLTVDEVATDSADLADALSYMRASALGLSPQGFASKLVLPASEVLFTEVEAPGPHESARRAQVARALEGMTPYAVSDLVFDIAGSGPRVQVAVVARETLEQAEAFAIQHRFNPVSFVAVPPRGAFAGEPFFGETAAARSFIAPGTSVERDSDPVVVLSREALREAAEAKAPPAVVPPPAVPPPAVPPPAAEISAPAPQGAAAPAPQGATAPVPQGAVPNEATPAAAAGADGPHPAAWPAEAAKVPVAPAPGSEEVPAASDVPAHRPAAAARAEADPVPAFSSRRREPPPPPPVQPAAAVVRAPLSAADGAAALLTPPRPAAPTPADEDRLSGRRAERQAARASRGAPPASAPPAAPSVAPPAAPPAAPRPAPVEAVRPAPPASPTAAATVSGAAAPAPPAARVGGSTRPLPRPAEAPARPGTAGALPGQASAAPLRGKPRYLGLVLTVVLLVFLALVAAWSTIYLSRDDGAPVVPGSSTGDAARNLAGEPVPGAPAPLVVTAGDPSAVPAAIPQAPESVPEAATGAVAETGTAVPEAPADVPAEAAPAGARAAAAEGAGRAAPGLAAATGDEIVLSAMDAPPPAFDALALPVPSALADAPPAAVMPPPPPGTVYSFDADGRIEASRRGIVTPDGVWLIEARPPRLPPPRPAPAAPPTEPVASAASGDAAPAPGPDAPGASAATGEAAAAFAPDAAAPGRRPTLRPEGLAPPAPAPALQAGDDDAALSAPPDPRFASLRPRARTGAVLARAAAAAETARAAAAASQADAELVAASLVQAGGASASAASAFAGASPLAVPISRRPAARPRDLSRAVSAAVAATTQPAPAAAPAAATAPAPRASQRAAPPLVEEDDDEPELAAARNAPRIPTSANVARQATFANAINLSRVNLIGIFGTPSNRYAMVRTPQGRITRVTVGDRVDGGTVAAITATEVRYQKGGRMLALTMPRG